MPRDNSGELRTEWKISLPATLAAQVEFLLLDAVHGKPTYGARSALIGELLRRYVEETDFDLNKTPTPEVS